MKPAYLNSEVSLESSRFTASGRELEKLDVEVLIPLLANRVGDEVGLEFTVDRFENVTVHEHAARVKFLMESLQHDLLKLCESYNERLYDSLLEMSTRKPSEETLKLIEMFNKPSK